MALSDFSNYYGLLLEKHCLFKNSKVDSYTNLLPDYLNKLKLSDSDIKIMTTMLQTLYWQTGDSTVIWALGKNPAPYNVRWFSGYIVTCLHLYKREVCYQSLIAAENFLDFMTNKDKIHLKRSLGKLKLEKKGSKVAYIRDRLLLKLKGIKDVE